ncbi:transmembrane protein 267-like [Magallana gigas]|uniref:transmembrane protein 267-like n=1 Tax=Magallana gigas TaxID=29159 RepID=UPI003341297F
MICHVILYEAALLLTCLLGDFLPSTVSGNHGNLWRALIDSLTHGGVAFFSWAVLVQARNMRGLWESLICGLLGMVIDSDHFIAARSLSLQAALSLRSRPFLHSSTLTLALCVLLFLTGHALNKGWIKLLSVMCFLAWMSHHVRDGSRRGLWFPPLGSTPAIPYSIYVTVTCLMPLVMMFVLQTCHVDFMSLNAHRQLVKEARLDNILPV